MKPHVGTAEAAAPTRLFPVVVEPQPPLAPGRFGVDIRILVRSSQTGNQISCVETAVAPRTLGPTPHLHHTLDELSLVVEGALTVYVDGTVYTIPTGGMQLRPHGLVHTFWNATDEPIRFIDMFLNQNFDDYLERYFRIMDEASRSPLGHADPELARRSQALDEEFGVVMFPEQRQRILDTYGLNG